MLNFNQSNHKPIITLAMYGFNGIEAFSGKK
jgi:hypothetical protein